MKREIKFRAWNSQQKMMVYDANYLVDNTPDAAMLMQFTGLLDAKGKEVYEGDIVTNQVAKWEVIFHTGCFCAKMIDSKLRKDHDIHLALRAVKGIEVIGNIYENPELI